MMPQPLKFKKKSWILIVSDLPVFAIEDYSKVEHMIKPQIQNENKALHPDCAFVFAQSNTYFFTINVAMNEKGFYYFGYGLYEENSGGGCYPSSRWRDQKKSSTLRGCLINALNYIKEMSKYHGQPPYPLYVRTATEALSKVKTSGVVQLSLFDCFD